MSADVVECTVCGEDVGRRGIGKHAGVHRREFRERFGRPPKDYDEVREALGDDSPPEDVATLDEFVDGGQA